MLARLDRGWIGYVEWIEVEESASIRRPYRAWFGDRRLFWARGVGGRGYGEEEAQAPVEDIHLPDWMRARRRSFHKISKRFSNAKMGCPESRCWNKRINESCKRCTEVDYVSLSCPALSLRHTKILRHPHAGTRTPPALRVSPCNHEDTSYPRGSKSEDSGVEMRRACDHTIRMYIPKTTTKFNMPLKCLIFSYEQAESYMHKSTIPAPPLHACNRVLVSRFKAISKITSCHV